MAQSLLTVISWTFAVPALAITAYLLVELVAGMRPTRVRRVKTNCDARDLAFLIPAHNEALAIGHTVADLREKAPEARILVVADNCDDDTAEIARQAGAEVAERMDPIDRGKGYALAFGRDILARSPPSVVVVIDADCTVSAGFANTMRTAVGAAQTPVQASNLFEPDLAVSVPVQISNFAMLVKNLFRMRGLRRLGGTVSLLGTGMGFPWTVFASLPLATGDATEDIKLSLDLVTAGGSVGFTETAKVWSSAESTKDTVTQRQRWEHGFLSHSLRFGVPNLLRGLTSFSRKKTALALHMLVPPIALLLSGLLVLICITGLAALLGGSPYPAFALVLATMGLFFGLVAAYLVEGRPYLSAKAIALAPVYLAWKLPIYLNFFRRRQRSWDERS